MDPTEVAARLSSHRPSERTRAAQWLLSHATDQDLRLLVDARNSEAVPAIQRMLAQAISRVQEPSPQATPLRESEGNSYKEFSERNRPVEIVLDSLSDLIRHETEPAIGWLRRSAARELGSDFEGSQTYQNIELLRRRLNGLQTLVSAQRMPNWTRRSLSSLIDGARPIDIPETAVAKVAAPSDEIETDVGLFNLILGNAFTNAIEASTLASTAAIRVETFVGNESFWVTVTNTFDGESFELEQMAHTGTSSKRAHKGLGLSAMSMAASRLGWQVSLSATGGTALFKLSGPSST